MLHSKNTEIGREGDGVFFLRGGVPGQRNETGGGKKTCGDPAASECDVAPCRLANTGQEERKKNPIKT